MDVSDKSIAHTEKNRQYILKIADLFISCAKIYDGMIEHGKEYSIADFMAIYPDVPQATVYTRIRALCKSGCLSRVGRGRYMCLRKPLFRPEITPWMREVNALLVAECVGVHHCLSQKESNLVVKAYKSDLEPIKSCLLGHGYKVLEMKQYRHFPYALDGFIIMEPLVSESPIAANLDIPVPSLEMDIVDTLCDKRLGDDVKMKCFQRNLEVYSVNLNTLKRYAARRGVSEELSTYLKRLSRSRVEMFSLVQDYLAGTQITKAWVFGSFSRGEEKPDSDLDLLIDYDRSSQISLLDLIRYKIDLEKLIHREVDLIEEKSLKPFAVPSAERDKYLIYAR